MREVVIDGKKYKLKPTLKNINKIFKSVKEKQSNLDYLMTALWIMIKPRFIFKPYIFKQRLANHIDYDEIAPIDKTIGEILRGDREGKNPMDSAGHATSSGNTSDIQKKK
jgi:hypothetical protein